MVQKHETCRLWHAERGIKKGTASSRIDVERGTRSLTKIVIDSSQSRLYHQTPASPTPSPASLRCFSFVFRNAVKVLARISYQALAPSAVEPPPGAFSTVPDFSFASWFFLFAAICHAGIAARPFITRPYGLPVVDLSGPGFARGLDAESPACSVSGTAEPIAGPEEAVGAAVEVGRTDD